MNTKTTINFKKTMNLIKMLKLTKNSIKILKILFMSNICYAQPI